MRCLSSNSEAEEKRANSSDFCSVQALRGLDDAHSRWGGQSTESTDSNASLTQKLLTLDNGIWLYDSKNLGSWDLMSFGHLHINCEY